MSINSYQFLNDTFIQIAGIKDKKEAQTLVLSGAKYLGFPLRLSVHEEDITDAEAADIISELPDGVNPILITYLSVADEIAELGDYLGVSYVQIHGDIDLSEIQKLRRLRPNWFIIKSLIVNKYSYDELLEMGNLFSSYVDAFITDTYDPETGASGATGKTHDWDISRKLVIDLDKPVILAGGLNQDNVIDAINIVRPAGVDTHTGLENSSGRKDNNKVKAFISKAEEALQKRSITFPNSLTVGTFDNLLIKEYKSALCEISHLVLDLRETNFIEVATLIYMLSLLDQRSMQHLDTTILIPSDKKVRDFWRIWKFPEAIKSCTGRGLAHYCVKEDVDLYFQENTSDDDLYYRAYSKEVKELVNDRFFSLNSYLVSSHVANTIALNSEASRWKKPFILEFLKRVLGEVGASSYVSARVVYEAMTNAFRHPEADIICTASFCDENIRAANKLITISFWDNGIPMHYTLKKALHLRKIVRGDVEESQHFKFFVTHRFPNGEEETNLYSTDSEIDKLSHDYEYFIACLFPGVSRDLSREIFFETDTAPGWGLVYLLNTCCEIYNGSVAFRSGNIFANVRRCEGDDNIRFRISINEYDNKIPHFNGNMVTVRLPIG